MTLGNIMNQPRSIQKKLFFSETDNDELVKSYSIILLFTCKRLAVDNDE